MRLYIKDVFTPDPMRTIRLLNQLRAVHGDTERDNLGSYWSIDEEVLWSLCADPGHPVLHAEEVQ